jgi:hypothetical protein
MTQDPWFSGETSGLLGALLGGGYCGVLIGAIGGGVCGPLAAKGIAKAFVLTYCAVMAALGAALLITGFVALFSSQPYAVWYPFVLCGSLGLGSGTMIVVVLNNKYRQADQRKLEAQELRTGSVLNEL